MSVIHIPKRPEIGIRQLLMLVAVFAALLVVFVRLWFLQVVKAADLTERALTLRLGSIPRLAPRGLIEDRSGKILAGVKSELVVTVIPDVMRRNPSVLSSLARITGFPVAKLEQRMIGRRPFYPASICTVPVEVATKVAESAEDLPGVTVESQPVRYYADDVNFSHVLGYVWTPNAKDVTRLTKQGIKPGEFVGKMGIEALYEKQLMGTPGTFQVEMDARQRPVQILNGEEPVPGEPLVLTLDTDLQKLAMTELKQAQADSPDSGGAVVAIDPTNGEVLCLASNPTFAANEFLNGISGTDYDRLAKDPLKPMFNRAISGAYSPGSTFKIVSTLASGTADTFDPGRVVFCPGYYEVGNRRSKCLGHHGSIRFRDALEKSCNTYFSDLAIRTGPEAIKQECLEVGLGRRSGIDLPGEGKAIVPTDDWLRAAHHLPKSAKPAWFPGDTVNLGIGQGELSVTPLQMADVASLVANQGICYKPHLVKRFGADEDAQPEVLWKIQERDEVWSELRMAMIQVIQHGTARRAEIPGVVWAGKTGSTEHSGLDKKTHSWFVGFAPAENPRIAIAVLVEQSGHGGEIAAPIAARIVAQYLGKGNE